MTGQELGFAYLRDNTAPSAYDLVREQLPVPGQLLLHALAMCCKAGPPCPYMRLCPCMLLCEASLSVHLPALGCVWLRVARSALPVHSLACANLVSLASGPVSRLNWQAASLPGKPWLGGFEVDM